MSFPETITVTFTPVDLIVLFVGLLIGQVIGTYLTRVIDRWRARRKQTREGERSNE